MSDIPPNAPLPPENDDDRPRWVREDMLYKQALGVWNERQRLKLQAGQFRPGSAASVDFNSRSGG